MKTNIIKLDENGETLEKLETFLKKQRPIKIEGYKSQYKIIYIHIVQNTILT